MSDRPVARAEASAAKRQRPSWQIRGGVRFPHWPSIRSASAEATLVDILELMQIEKCWRGYGATEDEIRCQLLLHYGAHGKAPTIEALAALARMSTVTARDVLSSLRERDLVVFESAQDHITGAYPFTDRDTGHRVTVGAITANAMCAIDALGAGAMYDQDAIVCSRCRSCDASIRIVTKARGSAIASIEPEGALVWSGLSYADNCAATSLCTVIAFFCSDAHLQAWRAANHPAVAGHCLSIAEAHEVGMAIFRPMLKRRPGAAAPLGAQR